VADSVLVHPPATPSRRKSSARINRQLAQPTISVVVPVYRSQDTLRELHRRLVAALEQIDPNFELILVEDCGGDDSWKVIEQLAQQDHRVHGIQHSRNFGQHAATICGFAHARGEWIVTLDDDLEQEPEYLPVLYQKAQEGYDLVYGFYAERTHKAWRNVTSSAGRWAFRKAIPSLNHAYTSYRVIRGDIARALSQFDSPFPFVDGYLSWLTNRYAIVEVPHAARGHGTSNYTFRKLLVHTLNIFVTFSDLPLRLSSWIGLAFFVIGMLWFVVIVAGKLFGLITVSGFASIMAAIILFGGIQLLILGIFGEYLGRMNFKSSRKPLYLVAHTTDSARED
jgi:undecaprenyl-phosphate 4-deoxy-4-formamido-L-arabinose transferase